MFDSNAPLIYLLPHRERMKCIKTKKPNRLGYTHRLYEIPPKNPNAHPPSTSSHHSSKLSVQKGEKEETQAFRMPVVILWCKNKWEYAVVHLIRCFDAFGVWDTAVTWVKRKGKGKRNARSTPVTQTPTTLAMLFTLQKCSPPILVFVLTSRVTRGQRDRPYMFMKGWRW